jgi:hypothetical protein
MLLSSQGRMRMSWGLRRRDGSSESWWELNEKKNALDYLEMAVHCMLDVERTPWAWKWVCISLHGALYGFGICALQGTNFEQVLQNDTVFWWDNVPGEDNKKLINYIRNTLKIDLAQEVKIERSEDDKNITISDEKDHILIKYNEKKSQVSIEYNGKRSKELYLKRHPLGIKVCKKKNLTLLSFDKVIERCQDRRFVIGNGVLSMPLILTEPQKIAIDFMKNELRNSMEHFIPKTWSIEIHGLPEMAASYFEIIEYLAGESGNMRWNDEEIKRIRALCDSGKTLALSTKAHL